MDEDSTAQPRDHDPKVQGILDDLYATAEGVCGKPMETSVKDWWFTHYRGSIYYALNHKKKEYDKEAKMQLHAKAQELGAAARKLAGNGELVTPLHACLAAFQVDCPPGALAFREDWCN